MHRFLSGCRLSPFLERLPVSSSLSLQNHVPGCFPYTFLCLQSFASRSGGDGDKNGNSWDQSWKNFGSQNPAEGSDGWDSISSWSTGLKEEDFEGQAVGRKVVPGSTPTNVSPPPSSTGVVDELSAEIDKENKWSKTYLDSWEDRMKETRIMLKQVREPGARGSYLKDSEKSEMYKLYKEDPKVYTVERLAKDYRITRQRVHAILWLKEMEEEEEKKLGRPLDDSIELLLDTCPEFINSHDKEFHVASLSYKPEFKVMPEGWDGTTRDPDEVLYEISAKEDEMLYQEFVGRMEFNKKKMAGEVKCHKYSRRRPSEGWNITVEKLGTKAKCGRSGGWRFVSLPDGSSRPLNQMEKMYAKRESAQRRRRILP